MFSLSLSAAGLKAVGLLVHEVAELLRGFGVPGLRKLLAHFLFDLGPDRLEGFLLAAPLASDGDDVVAEVRLDHIADLALLHGECRVLEGLDHGAAAEEIEISSVGRRARIIRVLPGHLGERCRVLPDFGEQFLSLGLGLVAFGSRRALVGLHEDMAGAPLFGHGIARGVLVVVLAQVVFGYRDALLDGLEVQDQVLDRSLLGRLEFRRVCRVLVVGLDVGIARIDLGEVVLRIELRQLDLALLQEGIERRIGNRLRRDGTAGHALEDLSHRKIAAQALGKRLRAHALCRKDVLVDRAVRVAQEGKLRVIEKQALQALVGRDQIELVGSSAHHLFAHQGLERLPLHCRRVEQLDVDVRRLRADAFDLVAMCSVQFGLGDGPPGHRGNGARAFSEP